MLRRRGRLALTTIELAPSLGQTDLARALALTSAETQARRPYGEMLAAAGFTAVGVRDVTDEYRRVLSGWRSGFLAERREIESVDGAEPVAERLGRWERALTAIEEGLLRRTIYWAIAGEASSTA